MQFIAHCYIAQWFWEHICSVTAYPKCSLRRLVNSTAIVGLACCCYTNVFTMTVEYGNFSIALVQLFLNHFPFHTEEEMELFI